MSTETSLDDFQEQLKPADGQTTVPAHKWDPTASVGTDDDEHDPRKNRCDNCGRHVPKRMGRVFGDETGCVNRCLGCSAFCELSSGGGAGKDTRTARGTSPERGGGRL